VPRIDKHIYSRENGLAIAALLAWFDADGAPELFAQASAAAEWITAHRLLSKGVFAHGEGVEPGGPYLSDTLEMGKAYLALYASSGDRRWLDRAAAAADAMLSAFYQNGALVTAAPEHAVLSPAPVLDENIRAARFLNLLSYYRGDERYRASALGLIPYLVREDAQIESINDSGLLLVEQELSDTPLHLTIVGAKNDPAAQDLFKAGRKIFSTYKRLEWWDKAEGNLPNPDVTYPQLPRAAAFVCTNKRCSLPAFTAEGLVDTVRKTRPK
jgi:uncharacterized protein YyaL (SSP411 family)